MTSPRLAGQPQTQTQTHEEKSKEGVLHDLQPFSLSFFRSFESFSLVLSSKVFFWFGLVC